MYTQKDLGVELKSPEDLLFDAAGNLYISDAGMHAIYVFSPQMQLLETIDSFENNGETDSFSSPYGIFLTPEGHLYVADYGNRRVVALDAQRRVMRIVEQPQSDMLSKTFVFQPQKVLVDSTNRLFVLSKNVNEGIMQFTEDGRFLGFYGSNTVSASLIDTE